MTDSVFRQQTAELYGKKYISAWVGIPFTAALALMFRDVFSVDLLITGFAVKVTVVLLRFSATYCHHQFPSWLSGKQWAHLYLVLLALDGLAWSSIAVFFVPAGRPEFIAGTAAIVASVAAIRTRILSQHLGAHLVFSSCLLLPAAAWHLSTGEHVFSRVAGGALLLFWTLIIRDGKKISDEFKARVRLQMDLDESLSALRVSEGRWKALYDASPIATFVWEDREGDWELVSFNQAARLLTNNQVENLLGMHASQLYADSPEVLGAFNECRNKGSIRRENLRYRLRSSGEERFVHANYVLVPDRYILVTTEDVTEKAQSDLALRNSLHEKEMLLSEVHHRVKNNLQVLASLISMQKKLVTDHASRVQLENLGLRVRAMGLLHTKLYRSGDLAKVDMYEYLSAIAEQVISAQVSGTRNIELNIIIQGVHLNIETALPLGLIANEVMVNAIKHAFSGHSAPRISITLQQNGTGYALEIRDNGRGMPENPDNSQTLGLRLVHVLVKQIKGELHISGNTGVVLTIHFFEQNKEENRWIN